MTDIPNKIKNTRVVTFKEDYYSPMALVRKAEAEKNKIPFAEDPIYRKDSTHAIHMNLVALLKDKGAKMEVKPFDYDGAVKRAKVQLAKNREKEAKMSYA